jgi:hypothetical protein
VTGTPYLVTLDELDHDVFQALNGDLTGAGVLDLVHGTLTKYVAFPSAEAADAVTLYAAVTHAAPHLEFATRLVIKSPVKRCGKSRLLDVLEGLVLDPLPTTNISPAALVHSIKEDKPPTIMLDEADAVFGKALKNDEKAEHLRGILNAGFTRGRPYRRWDVTIRKMENCPTFALAVIAGIGSMPDTIEDRAVVVVLQRQAPSKKAAKYRIRRDQPAVKAVGKRLGEWVTDRATKIGNAEPDLPSGLNDRAEDTWEALIATADLAGGDWPGRARKAARLLCADAEEDSSESKSTRLLADLRNVYGDGERFLYSATLTGRLAAMEGAPWAEWIWGKNGREPITQRGLAELLADYRVRSRDGREGGTGKNRKGYYADDLAKLWDSYLPARRASDGRDIRDIEGSDVPSPAGIPVADEVADDEADPRQDQAALMGIVLVVADVADPDDPSATEQATFDQDFSALVADVADDTEPAPEWADSGPVPAGNTGERHQDARDERLTVTPGQQNGLG